MKTTVVAVIALVPVMVSSSWMFKVRLLGLVMEKGAQLLKLLPVNATGCDHRGLWRRGALSFSKGCRYTALTQKMLYVLGLVDLPWHRKLFFLYEGCSRSLFLPSGKVLLLLMAVYSTARARIFTGQTKRHRTSTSHKYLFSTFLPASAFIYWLFGNFVWLSRGRRHTNRTQRMSQPVDE